MTQKTVRLKYQNIQNVQIFKTNCRVLDTYFQPCKRSNISTGIVTYPGVDCGISASLFDELLCS